MKLKVQFKEEIELRRRVKDCGRNQRQDQLLRLLESRVGHFLFHISTLPLPSPLLSQNSPLLPLRKNIMI
jgi:hypothetical protein